ncbi:MAG: chemotaxis protein CheW [Nitrosomonas sp.]|nr:MAG: chemotaxis protein CheW [Nitrosomonas sp.]
MASKKTSDGKPEDVKRIAPSIRKPAVAALSKLDQALDFAQALQPTSGKSGQSDIAVTATATESAAELAGEAQRGSTAKISAWMLMPHTEEDRKILRARTRNLSRRAQSENHQAREQYICFRLGESELYGISYRHAEQILPAAGIARVPCTPPVIGGIINYRGELLTVLDLCEFFRIARCAQPRESWILVVKEGNLKAGLIVDEVIDNDEFSPPDLSPPMDGNAFVRGIHQGKVVILDVAAIFANPAINIDESVS